MSDMSNGLEAAPPGAQVSAALDDGDAVLLNTKKKKKKKKTDPDAMGCDETADPLDHERLEQNYRQLLGRVQDLLHPDGEPEMKEKLKLPPPEVVRPGSKSATIANFPAFCQRINRPAEHVAAFVQTELGTSGSLDEEGRLRVKYANNKKVEQLLRKYVRDYVVCQACKSLTTIMVRGEQQRARVDGGSGGWAGGGTAAANSAATMKVKN